MSVEQTNIIDLVALDVEMGRLVLTISDHLEWFEDCTEHLLVLQEKLNAYLRFVESGEVLLSHPKAKGKPILIDVIMKHPPTFQGVKFLEDVRILVEGAGIMFNYRVFHEDAEPSR